MSYKLEIKNYPVLLSVKLLIFEIHGQKNGKKNIDFSKKKASTAQKAISKPPSGFSPHRP